MSAQGKSEKVVRRFYDELWNAWKLELIDELVAEDVRFRGSLGTTVSGREAFRKYVEGVRQAFPDWHNAIDDLLVIGDRVVTRMTWTGTHRGELSGMTPTGAVVRYVGAAFFRMDEGVIVEVWVVGDTQELWKSIGRL